MSVQATIGCELSKAARGDLRKAIRCLLVAGAICTMPWSAKLEAQEVPADYEAITTLDNVQAVALRLESGNGLHNIVPLIPNNTAFWLDGVLVGSTFLGSTDTESHDQQPPDEPIKKDNPEPRGGGVAVMKKIRPAILTRW